MCCCLCSVSLVAGLESEMAKWHHCYFGQLQTGRLSAAAPQETLLPSFYDYYCKQMAPRNWWKMTSETTNVSAHLKIKIANVEAVCYLLKRSNANAILSLSAINKALITLWSMASWRPFKVSRCNQIDSLSWWSSSSSGLVWFWLWPSEPSAISEQRVDWLFLITANLPSVLFAPFGLIRN